METKSKIKCSEINSLQNKQYKPDNSNLCLRSTSNDRIVVGNENGCFIHNLSSSNFEEVSFLLKKEVPSVEIFEENVFAVSCEQSVLTFDIRQGLDKCVNSFAENSDEINQIKVNENLNHLAACDDSGEIRIFDLRQQKLFKTLRRRHKNICACVSFPVGRTNEIVSGGLDNQLIRWDYMRIKPLQFVNTQEVLNTMGDNSVYMFNPPFVQSLCASQSGDFLAAGLGNGTLQIFQNLPGSLGLRPTYLVNKHSTVGIPALHYFSHDSQELLLTGGNDSCVNLWNIPMDILIEKKKTVIPHNKVCDNDEIEKFLLCSFPNSSKISCIDTFKKDGNTFVIFTDQSPDLKIVKLL